MRFHEFYDCVDTEWTLINPLNPDLSQPTRIMNQDKKFTDVSFTQIPGMSSTVQ